MAESMTSLAVFVQSARRGTPCLVASAAGSWFYVCLRRSCICASARLPPLLSYICVIQEPCFFIVEARINGTGPYKFVADTGSNMTLIESSLFHQLGLEDRGATSAKVIDGMALGRLALAREVSIGGQTVRNLEILEVDGMKRPDLGSSVRGVLG